MVANLLQTAPYSIFIDDEPTSGALIKVVGVGGGGGNAVNRMIEAGLGGIEYINANTDQQALKRSRANVNVQLGCKLTKGLGAGANPEIGRNAAVEDTTRIIEALEGADMVFVTAGLGGGTGSGAAPIIAALASELGALTVAVVTKPFNFEGKRRMRQAEESWHELRDCADTVITIPNEKLLATAGRDLPLTGAFCLADDVLRHAVQGISDLVLVPGLINLDFADVQAIMRGMGMALMGTGRCGGHDRAVKATRLAVESPLLDDSTIRGAKGVLINVTGGPDMTLHEVNDAASLVCDEADPDANIIFGAVVDESMRDEIKVTVIATGFTRDEALTAGAAELISAGRAAQSFPKMTGAPSGKADDLNVPAYLRVGAGNN